MTIAQLLKHDFKSKGLLYLYNSNGNQIYCEHSDGYWIKQEYDSNGNLIYCEYSYEFWSKYDYDINGKLTYREDSNGYIIDNRPKTSCDGKVVEIEGKRYQLNEIG
jgi:hypothetical protein